MVKAVIFDIDGTLLDSFEANLKFFQDLMARAGYAPLTREQYSRMYHLNMRDVIRTLTAPSSEDEITRIGELGRSREVEYSLELLRMPEHAEETIKALDEKYLLGIATSRLRDNVYEVPELAALRQYFRATVGYEDTLNHKPDPEPLVLAARQLGVEPRESVYVGDAETDVQAARAAGMKIIVYSKNPAAGADAATDSFVQLPELIASLQGTAHRLR